MDVANSFPRWEGRNKGERGFLGKSIKSELSLKEPGFLDWHLKLCKKGQKTSYRNKLPLGKSKTHCTENQKKGKDVITQTQGHNETQ